MNGWTTTGEAPTIALGIAVGAALLYGFLRLQAHTPVSGDPRRSARSHALWTAVIAFFASSTSGLSALVHVAAPTYVDDGQGSQWTSIDPAGHTTLGLAWVAASPGLWLGLVYVLAQFTWPRPNSRVRTASLEVRTLRDHLPRALAATLAVLSVLGLAAIAWAWSSPGVAPIPGRDVTTYDSTGDMIGSESTPAIDGLRAGTESGPWLLAALVVAVAATWIAALVIIRRHPLAGLSASDNRTIRLIGLNRLLRTAILVVGGILLTAVGSAMAAAQRAAMSAEEWSGRGGLMVGAAASGADKPWGWLVTVLFFGQFAVLVAMVAAAPPRLVASGDAHTPRAVAHLPGSLPAALQLLNRCHAWVMAMAMVPLVASLLALPGWAGPLMRFPPPALSGVEGPLLAASLPFAFYFLCMLGVEALLRRGHCPHPGSRRPTAHLPWPALPTIALCTGAGLYVLALVLSLATPHGDRSLVLSITVGLALAALPAIGWWLLVSRRPGLGRAGTAEDVRLRALSRHRILRLAAANLFMAAGLVVLMDSALWFHWSAVLGNAGGPLTWQGLRWTGSAVLFALAALAVFCPSAEFSRPDQPAAPPTQGPAPGGPTAGQHSESGRRP
ncbi:hypothetical protein [Arthrobacter sp. JSM 101049]|uniref:hypothetical protein n=1 Tax=Arthrobacter sp. JSM 101049 TaxID=929097 RepID=UPI003566B97E